MKTSHKYSRSFQYSTLSATITEMSLHYSFPLATAFVYKNIIRLHLLSAIIQTPFPVTISIKTADGCNHFVIAMNVVLCFAVNLSGANRAIS